MKKKWKCFVSFIALGAVASSMNGCAMFRTKVTERDVNNMGHMSSEFDATDMRTIADNLVGHMLASQFLQDEPEPPVMIISGVDNDTSRYEDTKNLTDYFRTKLFKSGQVKFIAGDRRDALLKEQGYQAANVTPETAAAIGRQIGAKYMVSGTLSEMLSRTGRQVRISNTKERYYKLTLEVVDLTTGLLAWTEDEEFARAERQPLIGW